ncbi:ubiquinol-cytochrome-c reductase complex assembly factor 1 [Rana temporaria]|uniref:ubiquinol-cytochrome-c reductase complex assembly factor 1 n=1 Tax=Rana temporaria TaxID=8407 RepID=UPI001AADBB3D|nr:ubiquinol-cytochrome-c reductase complex assembly factor 1 [Rana temporaria]
MTAFMRLGTLPLRISSQIGAGNAIYPSTAQMLWHRTCNNRHQSLCTFTKGFQDECRRNRHKTTNPTQITAATLTTDPEQIRRTLHTSYKSSATKDELQPSEEEVGTFTKIIEAMGFTGPLKYSKWKIKIAALRMYTCCVDRIDYEEFFEKCNLPDTLNSWFLVTQLHVWMCMVRMKQQGREGKYMCRFIVYSMWEDAEQRGKVMGIDSVTMKKTMRALTEIFYASIFGYDEGIISDDRVLSAALWRNLFNMRCDDPRQLELMVEYVRKQMQYLDSLNGEDLLLTGEVTWRPLVENDPQSILKPSPPTYNDEGL